jgi:hypothetical protein
MAHGVSLQLAKIPRNRFYNYQPAMRCEGLWRYPIIRPFTPAGRQVAKRELMAARAEKRRIKREGEPKRENLRLVSTWGRGQQLPREDR